MAESNVFDAIVIGSGISGGWAAKELTEKGLKVIMLERGRDVKHAVDYPAATKNPWEFPHRGGRTQEMINNYPVLKRDYPLNEMNLDFWVKDSECPYTEIKRFDWFRGYHVGGRSLMWGRQSYRWSDLDFEANAKEGIGTDWPIRYNDIAPWYDYVEKFAGISGSKEGLDVLPDGMFQPPMEMTCVEKDVAELEIGLNLKETLTEPGGWTMGMMGFGEILPYHENKVTLDKTQNDKWGLNVLAIDCELKDNELKMRKDMLADGMEMLEAAGVKNVTGSDGDGTPGRGIHEMGTARMGRDPQNSVLNKWNQVWDATNVFVTDGACMTSGSCVNPSLTYMALTARAADYAVNELKKGNL